ncbi:ABC transporter substrate-binding protein [bacterium]|nr:ABC transporter substrate-binding protein [bacterium]
MNSNEPRIISLIASSTEIVHALGLGRFMVGRSHECDYPESIASLPVCTGPKFRTDGSSYQIDQKVRALVQEGLSVYKVDADMIEALAPSHIITQDQCEVCAVSLRDIQDAACELISSKPEILSLKPDCLNDLWQDIEKIGASLNVERVAAELIETLKKRIEAIETSARAEAEASQKRSRVKVACIEWIDPLMAAGNWMPELVELAGGENLFGVAGKHSPYMSWSEILEKDPDVIIVTPCGFDNDRTLQEMHLLKEKEGFGNLRAVKQGRVVVADGNQYFNRPGPRLVESLEMMAEIFYPHKFDYGHKGKGWLTYGS